MISLRLGISTCPNDTFIYEALVRGMDGSPFQWDVTFADVQTLNEMVLALIHMIVPILIKIIL